MTEPGRFTPLHRVRDVTFYFATHVLAALVLALPLVALVGGTGIGRFPEGDRLLFQPGGLVLADVAQSLAPELWSSAGATRVSGALLFVLLLLPHTALLVSLSRAEREPLSAVLGRAVGHLPPLLLLSGLALLLQALVLFAAAAGAGMLRDAIHRGTTRNADLAYLAAVLFGLSFALVLGLVRDLARAAVVRGAPGTRMALRDGLVSFARAPGRSLLGWAAPAAVGLALVSLGAVLTTALDVSRPGAWRVWLVALLHQTIAYALCWCRAFWLSASLSIVKTAPIASGSKH